MFNFFKKKISYKEEEIDFISVKDKSEILLKELQEKEKQETKHKNLFQRLFWKDLEINFGNENTFLWKIFLWDPEKVLKSAEEQELFKSYVKNNLNRSDLKLPWIKFWHKLFKANNKDRLYLFDMLIVYYKSWRGIRECFEILKYKTNKPLLSAYYEWIRIQLYKGIALDIILQDFPSLIKTQQLYLLKIWFESGALTKTFEAIRNDISEEIRNKRNINQITLYPKIVMSVSFSILIWFIMFWLPKIAEFVWGREKLPAIAKFSYAIYTFLTANFAVILIWLWLYFFLHYTYISRSHYWISRKDKFILTIPVFNKLFKMIYIKTIFFYLFILTESKKNPIESLELIKNSMTNYYFYLYICELQKEVSTWTNLFQAFINISLREYGESIRKTESIYVLPKESLFDDVYVTYVQTGIKTGTLVTQYEELYKKLHEDIRYFIANMKSAVEFWSLLLIAPVVLFIMLNVYLSLFSIYNNIG